MAVRAKTNRSAGKRFRITGKGKVKVRRANRSHNFTGKRQKLKRQRRGQMRLKKCDAKRVKEMFSGSTE